MLFFLYFAHIVTCFFLILVVLLQQGKGADLSVFGGGSTQAAFGARGAATLLHKLTVGCFVLFLATTMSIGIATRGGGSSIMSDVESPGDEEAQSTEAPAVDERAPADSSAAEPVPDEPASGPGNEVEN